MRQSLFSAATAAPFIILVLACITWLLSCSPLLATPDGNDSTPPLSPLEIPEQYGAVIYQSESAATTTLYIIANGHRSAFSGANTSDTIQAQLETFRIGEWLIQQNKIELLLPEGFFGSMETSGFNRRTNEMGLMDTQSLQRALGDTSLFVNAELLLHENYGIGLGQIEDRQLYRHARSRLRSALAPETTFSPALSNELVYLQKRRTANLLQRAPSVIESAYQQGRISSPNAMLTIGLAHLDDLISYLKAGEISIAALQTADSEYPALASKLEMQKKQLNVTVIVPRSLIFHHNGG